MGYALCAGRRLDSLLTWMNHRKTTHPKCVCVWKESREVIVPKRDFSKFPRANGHVKMAGEGSGVRPSDRIRQDTEDGDEHRNDLQGETAEPDSAEPQQEQDDLEAKHDVWSISGSFIYRHHITFKRGNFVRATVKLIFLSTQNWTYCKIVRLIGVTGFSTHANNKFFLCLRLWKFRSARSSFFILLSFFFSHPESCLKICFL